MSATATMPAPEEAPKEGEKVKKDEQPEAGYAQAEETPKETAVTVTKGLHEMSPEEQTVFAIKTLKQKDGPGALNTAILDAKGKAKKAKTVLPPIYVDVEDIRGVVIRDAIDGLEVVLDYANTKDKSFGISLDTKKLLMAGKVETHNRAMAKARAKDPSFELRIAGNGLQNADLTGIDFEGVILTDANFGATILKDAKFKGALLVDTKFTDAEAKTSADVTGATGFTVEQLSEAKTLPKVLPEGITAEDIKAYKKKIVDLVKAANAAASDAPGLDEGPG
ncbi:MAG: hypothetical protein DHS20C02_02800 [Micavibrio sp.]|nr:MAG: hypothetical protein DHS20C02_02800 [Micavibrio sp.]